MMWVLNYNLSIVVTGWLAKDKSWKLSPPLGSQQISDHRFWLVPAYNAKRLLPMI